MVRRLVGVRCGELRLRILGTTEQIRSLLLLLLMLLLDRMM